MLRPRPYQSAAEAAVFHYWSTQPGNPLIDLATGLGKSFVAASLIKRLVDGWPGMRIIVATHVAELIEQNYIELIGLWPLAPAGIYSAGLGRRDARAQVLFAGIQTVHNKAAQIGHVDLVMVDEAHLIPANSETMYGRFIAALKDINPDLKVLGLTATPFRLDSGRLDEGDNRLFDKVVFQYGIADGVADGYLAPLTSKGMATSFDLSNVHKQGGDYKQSELQAAVDVDEITASAVAEIVEKGAGRKSWLVFASGVDHALHVRDAIRSYGITCETVTGDTPKDERRRIIEGHKSGEIRAVTNNSVLTTGYNNKAVDLIAFMRPTLSTSLYLQMAGRGTRVLYAPGSDLSTLEGRLAGIASGPKPNCLVLDFAGLVRRHGPVDKAEPKRPTKGLGDAPVKQCPDCDELVHISIMTCPCCGHVFPPSEEEKLTRTAEVAPILSTEPAQWYPVTSQTYRQHDKIGGTPSVRCDFVVGNRTEKTWICPQHTGFAKTKADRFWLQHGGNRPFPATVDEFLGRADELVRTAEIQVDFSGKFSTVMEMRAGSSEEGASAAVVEKAEPRKGNVGSLLRRARPEPAYKVAEFGDIDDEIPF